MLCLSCVPDALLLIPHFKMLYVATLLNSIATYFPLCLTSLITPLSKVLFLSETVIKPLSPAVRHSETPDRQTFDGDLRQIHIRLNQIRRTVVISVTSLRHLESSCQLPIHPSTLTYAVSGGALTADWIRQVLFLQRTQQCHIKI